MNGGGHMTLEQRLEKLEARLQAAEDQLEIIRLLSTYGPAVDSGASRAAAELWTQDGAYDVGGMNRFAGHDALEALYEAEMHQSLIRQGSAHITSTPQITLEGDRAEAVAYSMVVLAGEDGHTVWRASANHWELRRTPEGWRIVTRTNRVLNGSEESHALLKRAVK